MYNNLVKKSKLAIASFVLSLIPVTVAITLAVSLSGFTNVTMGDGTQTTVRLLKGSTILSAFKLAFVYSSIMTFWIGILAVVLGIVALIKIKGNNFRGKWLAIAGMVIGVIPLIIWLVLSILNSSGVPS